MIIYCSILVICLLIFAFISLSETGLTASSKPWIESQALKGSKKAKLVSKLLSSPDRLITSVLISSTLSNSIFTVVVTSITISLFEGDHLFLESIVVTIILLIFGEILPKTFAFSKPTSISLFVAPIIYALVWILNPIVSLFLYINKFFLITILRQKESGTQHALFSSVESLRGAIELFDREENDKEIVSEERAMLHSILDLTDITVADILNHRKNVFCIDINESTSEIIKQVLNNKYTRIPIYKENIDHIIGILDMKDFFREYRTKGENINLDKLIKQPYFVPETTYVMDLLMQFKSNQERLALIVDEYGSFMGILTFGDILEEIVGDTSESKTINSDEMIKHVNENTFIINADFKIRDLNRKMGWKLPDENFTTIAGLILYETGKIPNVGNTFIFYGFKFEILEKKNQQITKIKIYSNLSNPNF